MRYTPCEQMKATIANGCCCHWFDNPVALVRIAVIIFDDIEEINRRKKDTKLEPNLFQGKTIHSKSDCMWFVSNVRAAAKMEKNDTLTSGVFHRLATADSR